MAAERIKFERENQLSFWGLGSLVLIGLCTVMGFVILLRQGDELRTANVALKEKVDALEISLANERAANQRSEDNLVAGLREVKEVAKLEVGSIPKMVETGKGWIFLTRVEEGSWIGSTVDPKGKSMPDELRDEFVHVTNSVYIRKSPPSADSAYALGKSVGVARRGQYVRLGRVVETKPGSWYGEVTRVSGSPDGDKSLGAGFFSKSR